MSNSRRAGSGLSSPGVFFGEGRQSLRENRPCDLKVGFAGRNKLLKHRLSLFRDAHEHKASMDVAALSFDETVLFEPID